MLELRPEAKRRSKMELKTMYGGGCVFFLSPKQTEKQSDEVHEDFVLHDAGDLRHPGLGHRPSLTCRHQHLTCTEEGRHGIEDMRRQRRSNHREIKRHSLFITSLYHSMIYVIYFELRYFVNVNRPKDLSLIC